MPIRNASAPVCSVAAIGAVKRATSRRARRIRRIVERDGESRPADTLGATVCFSRIDLTSHGSPAPGLVADVVVLPLRTRH